MLTPKRQQGFSLVELMVSVTIGMIVLAGVISIFANSVATSGNSLRTIRLNQEMRAIMSVMVADLRRAGYWSQADSAIGGAAQNPFVQGDNDVHVGELSSEPANSCISYSYDRDDDDPANAANVDADEQLGFRLNDGRLEMATGSADCSGGGDWAIVNNDRVVTITTLSFTADRQGIDIDNDGTTDITIKLITIVLSAQLSNDAKVSRSMFETVRVMNDTV